VNDDRTAGGMTSSSDQPDAHRLASAARQLAACSWNSSTWCSRPWNATYNDTDSVEPLPSLNYGAVVLVLIPMLTVFGNSLVIISVIREKTLRTATNYFIVSLATSDVMVALLVMPLSIYSEVQSVSLSLSSPPVA